MSWSRRIIAACVVSALASVAACGGRLVGDEDNESPLFDAGSDASSSSVDASTTSLDAWVIDGAIACHPIGDASIPDAANDGGLFLPSTSLWSLGGAAIRIAVGDVTGDGRDDVVVTVGPSAAGINEFFVFAQDACGGLEPPVVRATTSSTDELLTATIGDVTGDGRNDVVSIGTSALIVVPQNADGALGASLYTTDLAQGFDVALADFNDDGKLDAVQSDEIEAYVFLESASGLQQPITYDLDPHLGGFGMHAADFNGDGLADMAVVDFQGLYVRRQKIGGGFENADVYAVQNPRTQPTNDSPTTAVGDFNGDGRIDIAVDFGFTGDLSIFHQTTAGTMGTQTAYANEGEAGALAAADVDGDGRTDLVKVGSSLTVYLQTTDGGIASPSTYAIPQTDGLVAVGDLNSDGKLDVVTATAYVPGVGSSLIVSYGAL